MRDGGLPDRIFEIIHGKRAITGDTVRRCQSTAA